MLAMTILKCIMVAKTEIYIAEEPINEYAMATISQEYKGVQFEGTVVEGRMNSIKISIPKTGAETMSFSTRDYDLRALSTRLTTKNEFATLDCEITEKAN